MRGRAKATGVAALRPVRYAIGAGNEGVVRLRLRSAMLRRLERRDGLSVRVSVRNRDAAAGAVARRRLALQDD